MLDALAESEFSFPHAGVRMTAIVSINRETAEFEYEPPGPPELRLILTDKDGQRHSITFEATALREFVELLRGIQSQFPGALGGH